MLQFHCNYDTVLEVICINLLIGKNVTNLSAEVHKGKTRSTWGLTNRLFSAIKKTERITPLRDS